MSDDPEEGPPAKPSPLLPAPPSGRKPSPAEGIRVQGQGWGVTIPAVLVTSVATALVTRLTAPAPTLSPDEWEKAIAALDRDIADQAAEVRETAEEWSDVDGDGLATSDT